MATIKYAANGKRDIHELEGRYIKTLALTEKDTWKNDNNRKLILEYLKACRRGQAKSAGRNKRIGASTLYRVLGLLRLLSEKWLDKDFKEATPEDWESLYERFEDDKIKNEYGRPFKPSARAKNYKTIRKFLKWGFGNNQHYPSFCEGWVTTEESPEKDHLTRGEVEKLVTAAGQLRTKTALMMLFDGGFRIEEFSNLRWVDVQKPEGKNYYRASVRKETTKTKKPREVSLWLATEIIDTYKMSERSRLGNKFDEQGFMFMTGYHAFSKTIKSLAVRALGKNISLHTLRHSSATYYSGVIKTYQQFCARYGWALKSSAPQRYFHSVEDDIVADQTKEHEIARFRHEFEHLKLENKRLAEELDDEKRRTNEKDKKRGAEMEEIRKLILTFGKALGTDVSKLRAFDGGKPKSL